MQESLEFRRMFVRYISHEIRTPMNTVKMGLELLTEELPHYDLPPDVIGYLSDSTASCNIAIEVLNDLLTLDKLENNALQLEMIELEVVPFVNRTIQPFYVQVCICVLLLNFFL
jgi:signal transduction histidine kinase